MATGMQVDRELSDSDLEQVVGGLSKGANQPQSTGGVGTKKTSQGYSSQGRMQASSMRTTKSTTTTQSVMGGSCGPGGCK